MRTISVQVQGDHLETLARARAPNSPENLELCERRAGGATRPRVARRELASLPLLLPPPLLQRNFREAAEPLNQQRANLYRQNEKLRAARDLLLPRLMSGDLAV